MVTSLAKALLAPMWSGKGAAIFQSTLMFRSKFEEGNHATLMQEATLVSRKNSRLRTKTSLEEALHAKSCRTATKKVNNGALTKCP